MNLLSIKRGLEHLKTLARARCCSGCVCQYVEVIEGQHATTEQEQTFASNRQCYERYSDRTMHVGFSSVLVPASWTDRKNP